MLTLATYLEEHFIRYVPVEYDKQVGKSKVKTGRDRLRMLQILVAAILYYDPLKLFLPVCIACVVLGLVVAFFGLLLGAPSGSLFFFGLSILVALVIGSIGFLAEVSRSNRSR